MSIIVDDELWWKTCGFGLIHMPLILVYVGGHCVVQVASTCALTDIQMLCISGRDGCMLQPPPILFSSSRTRSLMSTRALTVWSSLSWPSRRLLRAKPGRMRSCWMLSALQHPQAAQSYPAVRMKDVALSTGRISGSRVLDWREMLHQRRP